MIMAERIARTLTESFFHENEDDTSFASEPVERFVEQHWRAHLPLARDVLQAIRLPDSAVSMALAETGAWETAIDDALAEAAHA